MKSKDTGALTFQTFQEHTSIPVMTVREAVITASDPPADFLTKKIALLKLSVANEVVNKSISSKLRLSLSVGASLKRFELMRDEQWYRATAVPKKQSKEIVYKEKEQGRAAVSNIGSESNVFEIKVSPLPCCVGINLRLEIMLEAADVEPLACSLLAMDSSTKVSMVKLETGPRSVSNSVGAIGDEETFDGVNDGGAIVGDCFEQTHFCAKSPRWRVILFLLQTSSADSAYCCCLGHFHVGFERSDLTALFQIGGAFRSKRERGRSRSRTLLVWCWRSNASWCL